MLLFLNPEARRAAKFAKNNPYRGNLPSTPTPARSFTGGLLRKIFRGRPQTGSYTKLPKSAKPPSATTFIREPRRPGGKPAATVRSSGRTPADTIATSSSSSSGALRQQTPINPHLHSSWSSATLVPPEARSTASIVPQHIVSGNSKAPARTGVKGGGRPYPPSAPQSKNPYLKHRQGGGPKKDTVSPGAIRSSATLVPSEARSTASIVPQHIVSANSKAPAGTGVNGGGRPYPPSPPQSNNPYLKAMPGSSQEKVPYDPIAYAQVCNFGPLDPDASRRREFWGTVL